MLYQQRTFQNSTEVVDENVYKACVFENCTLVYRGGPVEFIQCHLSRTRLQFEGRRTTSLASSASCTASSRMVRMPLTSLLSAISDARIDRRMDTRVQRSRA